jgi:hypothetical protein
LRYQRVVPIEADHDQAGFLQQVLASIVGAVLRRTAMVCAVVLQSDARLHVQQIQSAERSTGVSVVERHVHQWQPPEHPDQAKP